MWQPFSEVVQPDYDNISDMLAISHGTAKEMFLSREILLLVKCMKNHVRSHPGFCAGWLYEKGKNKTETRNISTCNSNARQTPILIHFLMEDAYF